MSEMISIIIPSRNERYLQPTLDDLLEKAVGEIEIIPVIEGPSHFPTWPSRPDARVRPIQHAEALGMRPAINVAALEARGKYLMKCDAHCIFAPGYDVALKAACEDDWLAVPTRHSIDPETWTVKPRNFNYHYMTFPYDMSMYGYGLHAKTHDWYENKRVNAARAGVEIDDLMTFQGSCWFMHRAHFMRVLHPLDHANFYFYQEAQEVGLKTWLSGGRCVINKRTWYAHLHKGSSTGRGFYLSLRRKRMSEAYGADYFMADRWEGRRRDFRWYVEKFWPIPEWPADWDHPRHREAFLARTEKELPPHL
jgi:glycosyltransferase involved in cell wall biosynthesis